MVNLPLPYPLGNARYFTSPSHFIHLISTTPYVSPPYASEQPGAASPGVSALPFVQQPVMPNLSLFFPSSLFPAVFDMGLRGMPRYHDAGKVSSSGFVRETATPRIPEPGSN
jgi:hypothetical protein